MSSCAIQIKSVIILLFQRRRTPSISLLNVEGKIFFILVVWLDYLKENGLIDISVKNAGIPGFSGCLEHGSMIWHEIQAARTEGRASELR